MTTSRTGSPGGTPSATPHPGYDARADAAPAPGAGRSSTAASGEHAPAVPDVRPAASPRPGDDHGVPARPARRPRGGGDAGMTTAEYAVGTVAACGFAAVLYKVVTSDAVARLLRGVIEQAFSASPL